MFWKLAAIVAALGVVAAGLLSLRQSRLQVASELAQCQLRIGKADDRLWSVRTQVAAAVTPARIERLASSLGPLRPVTVPDVVGPPLPGATPTYAQRPVIVLPAPVPPSGAGARIINTGYAGAAPRPDSAASPAATPPSKPARPRQAAPAPTRSRAAAPVATPTRVASVTPARRDRRTSR